MIFGVQSYDVQNRCSVLFDVQYLSALGHVAFGHSALGPYSAFGQIRCSVLRCSVLRCSVIRCSVIRCSVIRCSVIRCAVIRCSVIQCSVFRHSVIRCSVIRRSVFRRSVGESKIKLGRFFSYFCSFQTYHFRQNSNWSNNSFKGKCTSNCPFVNKTTPSLLKIYPSHIVLDQIRAREISVTSNFIILEKFEDSNTFCHIWL
jgi:hypothetical protein